MDQEEVSQKSFTITQLAAQLPIWDHICYHIFLSLESKKEVATAGLISALQKEGKQVVVPKVVGDSLEHMALQQDTQLAPNKWGIPEPVSGVLVLPKHIDVVFIPLLAFDRHGNRVGYGKGFYDRFLSECGPDTLKIGLSFFAPCETITDVDPWDIPLDWAVEPNGIYQF